jgi:hypothetical protein
MDLPRQPQPVKVVLEGDPIDVSKYIHFIMNFIEVKTYDTCTRTSTTSFTIYPRAVND